MIAIIDYQMGNLRSVQKGFEKIGHQAQIVSDPDQLSQATKIVLPGVGAFKNGLELLKKHNLAEVISEAAERKKYILGICLGMQLFFNESSELSVSIYSYIL